MKATQATVLQVRAAHFFYTSDSSPLSAHYRAVAVAECKGERSGALEASCRCTAAGVCRQSSPRFSPLDATLTRK